MTSIALIGGDGAGKTTIAHNLEASCPLPLRYVYMGFGMQSSNYALPTSRLALLLKRRAYGKAAPATGEALPPRLPADQMEYSSARRDALWVSARFLNRLAEAWYRQIVAIVYQLRGDVVLYDRHFLFDSIQAGQESTTAWEQKLDALYCWLMRHLFPRPGLTIFLDAPAAVLYARKGEANPEYLDRQRTAFLKQGARMKHFVRIDATQPLADVLAAVQQQVLDFCQQTRRSRAEQRLRTTVK